MFMNFQHDQNTGVSLKSSATDSFGVRQFHQLSVFAHRDAKQNSHGICRRISSPWRLRALRLMTTRIMLGMPRFVVYPPLVIITSAHLALTHLVVRTRLFVLRLVEKEVGSEFFILITSKVSLDGCISVESEAAKLDRISNEYDLIKLESYPLDSVTLLLSNRNSLSSRG